MTSSSAPAAPPVRRGRAARGRTAHEPRSRRVRTAGFVLAATLLALGVAACSTSEGVAPQTLSAHTTTSPTGPTSTGPSGSDGSGSPTAPAGDSTGPTSTEATGSTSGSGSVSSTADMTGMTPSSTMLLPTTRTPTSPVLPPQTSISLASSLVVTMTVAPGVDTTGIDIEGAKAAYYGFVDVADRAVHDPTQNWEPEIRRFAIDPAAADALSEISDMVATHSRFTGHASFSATAKKASRSEIALWICVDNRGQDVIDVATGKSVKAGLGGRHPQEAVMSLAADGHWFLRNVRGFPDRTC